MLKWNVKMRMGKWKLVMKMEHVRVCVKHKVPAVKWVIIAVVVGYVKMMMEVASLAPVALNA